MTNHQPLSALSQEGADAYFDFDLPGSPVEECEYSRLLETTPDAAPDVAPESGYVCASPISSPENSEAAINHSRSSSDEPFFDPENSDAEQQSLSIDFYDCDDSLKREAVASARNESKRDKLMNGHAIFHSMDSDSCSESLPKSQSTTNSISTCNALSSASNHTLHDDGDGDGVDNGDDDGVDETDFYVPRDDDQPKLANGDSNHVIDGCDVKENGVDESESTEAIINSFKPMYRKHSREERKDEIEISNDARLINEIIVHESTPDIPDIEKVDEEKDDSTTNQNGHLSANEDDDEVMTRPQRIRRCSSLKTGKTPPGTPGRKKIVRFADMMGLDLADVRTFLDEVPRVPKCAFEDLELSLPSLSQMSLGPRLSKVLMPMFQQPGALPNFLDIVQEQNVAMENAAVTDPICLTITGSVRVRNLDFHKSVHLRYSTDSWRSYADLQATYVDNSCDGFSDKFTFILFGNALQVGERIEIAVRFSCKGQQFWDNNFGVNYCFQCLPATAPAPQRTPQNGTSNPVALSPEDTWCGSSFY